MDGSNPFIGAFNSEINAKLIRKKENDVTNLMSLELNATFKLVPTLWH